MQLNKLLYQLLVITIVVGLYTFGATVQTSVGEPIPILDKLEPIGGREGDNHTIVGKNFGNNISNITITLWKWEEKNGNRSLAIISDNLSPSYVYIPDKNQQKLEFDIPTDKGIERDLNGSDFFTKKASC